MKVTQAYTSQLSIPTLFDAWISPEILIAPIVKVEVLPEVGGHFILHAQSETGVLIMRGKFLKLEQNQRLQYTWEWEGTDETTTVSVDFKTGKEANTIRVTHEGFLTEESKALYASGWDHYFKELEIFLTNATT